MSGRRTGENVTDWFARLRAEHPPTGSYVDDIKPALSLIFELEQHGFVLARVEDEPEPLDAADAQHLFDVIARRIKVDRAD